MDALWSSAVCSLERGRTGIDLQYVHHDNVIQWALFTFSLSSVPQMLCSHLSTCLCQLEWISPHFSGPSIGSFVVVKVKCVRPRCNVGHGAILATVKYWLKHPTLGNVHTPKDTVHVPTNCTCLDSRPSKQAPIVRSKSVGSVTSLCTQPVFICQAFVRLETG